MNKRKVLWVGMSFGFLFLTFFLWQLFDGRSVSYRDTISNLSFSYPNPWGAPEEVEGNETCPEEDTYRTPDTLSIFDRELRFKDADLKGTDSFLRTGIRFYKMNPKVSNECSDDVLLVLAKREMTGEEFSSFRLVTANIPGFYGVVNENASRLDTEYRYQYTLFKEEADGKIIVVQPYLSFVPYSGSPEWQEIEMNYKGDISSFIGEGESSKEVRKILEEFRQIAESFNI